MAKLPPIRAALEPRDPPRSTPRIIIETLTELREQEKRLSGIVTELVRVREATSAELSETRQAIRALEGTPSGRPEPQVAEGRVAA